MFYGMKRRKTMACIVVASILIGIFSPIGAVTVTSAIDEVMDYSALQARMNAAGADTIALGSDITGSTQLTVIGEKTLDLNGHNLTITIANDNNPSTGSNGILLATGGTLTIKDSQPGMNKLVVTNLDTSSSIDGTNAGINSGDGEIIIESGTVEATGGRNGAGIGGGKNATGTVTIIGGTVTGTGGTNGAGIGSGSCIDIDDGATTAGTVTIIGGTVTGTGGYDGAGIGGGSLGVGIVNIEGGTVTGTGVNNGAGIGGGAYAAAGYVTILGGTVTGNCSNEVGIGYNPNGAGIGGGHSGVGIVNIEGGTVIGTGVNDGAGIGGGGSAAGTVTIIGGTVTGTADSYGAGIGGGAYAAGTVTIISGTVTGTAVGYGAGIGGGSYAAGTVTIIGGTVTGTGGYHGAGIGGGDFEVGIVNIEGGTVTGIGVQNGAGIGGGRSAAGTVTIAGGYVSGNGGNYAAGIGGGYYQGLGSYNGAGIITINGGCIAAQGGDDSDIDIGGDSLHIHNTFINGGSVTGRFNAGNPKNAGNDPLYLLTLAADSSMDDKTVLTVNMTPSITYTAPVRHKENISYLWLPEGEATLTYSAYGITQTENITITNNNTNAIQLNPIPPANDNSTARGSTIPITVSPHINGSNLSGWKDIEAYLLAETFPADKQITIDMGSSTVVPGSVLEALRGKKLAVTFVMAEGIEWVIEGEDFNKVGEGKGILRDIDLKVSKNSSKIPADKLSLLEKQHGVVPLQLTLAYSGYFGFGATLRIRLDEKEAGRMGNLYYYNPATGRLTLQEFGTCEKDGYIELLFTHASDYVLVMDDGTLLQAEMNKIKITPTKKTLYVGGTTDKNANIKLTYPNSLKEQQRYSKKGHTTYQARNKKVASVSTTGKIAALKQGKTSITTKITLHGVSVSIPCDITVKNASLKIVERTGSMNKGDKFTFRAIGYGIKPSNISWSTTNQSILKIDKKKGTVTAISKGTAYVVAKYGKIRVTYKVVVKE